MQKIILLIFSYLISSLVFSQNYIEFDHNEILSFEKIEGITVNDLNSSLTVSNDHYKHLENSLNWSWNSSNSYWSIKKDVNYVAPLTETDPKISTFIFWVYSKDPKTEGKMLVEFLKDGKVATYFEYGLDFSGWRGAWIAFDRDMCGTPVEGMNEVRFSVPGVESGSLYFDHIILSSMQDARHHTADFQAPFINKETTNHWLILYKSWLNEFDYPLIRISDFQIESANILEKRLREYLLKNRESNVKPIKTLRSEVSNYNITRNEDGTIKGVPVFFERFGEAYQMFGAERYNILYNNIMGLKRFNSTLLDISIAWNFSNKEDEKKEIESLFITMISHMLDQGFQAGSALGTLHHLGYSMRDYYPAVFLMSEVLEKNGLKSQMQQALEWFAGTGEVKKKTDIPGMDVDTFNTNLIARLASILMIDNMPVKVEYLISFIKWLNNGYQYSDGTGGTFKIDGTMFHHRHNYPAYAVDGMKGAVEAVYLLRNTAFSISDESHQILKKALLSLRFYTNLRTWPLSLSGRHPDGKGSLDPEHFGILALAGSPDGVDEIDREMAEAYLRLYDKENKSDKQKEITDILKQKGFEAEKSPIGNRTFNYSSLNVHRRDDWMVSAMGHSRYLWATEIYRNENLFGRYLNHGSLQILTGGEPISNYGSGFNQEGWDWNHFPGTTASVLPIEKLRADVKNLDNVSGYEEMLLSDESFSGGISVGGKNGAFGMKLHEHDKYNGSLKARKSVFFFDNRVISLGSNIESELPEETHTTLFQVYLEKEDMPFFENGKINNLFPYRTEIIDDGVNVISDGLNNYFFVQEGNLVFKKGLQHSFHEETGLPTTNNFALASINHGSFPTNGSYNYMILLQPKKEDMESIRENSLKGNLPYIALQQDSVAHIVKDIESNTTGYVIFEAGEIETEGIVKSANLPSMVMTHQINEDKVVLAACDPDLRFYEGPADEIYDDAGKRIERSVYSREWINNSSGKSFLRITISGSWEIGVINNNARVLDTSGNYTTIEFECQHGLSEEVLLIRKKIV